MAEDKWREYIKALYPNLDSVLKVESRKVHFLRKFMIKHIDRMNELVEQNNEIPEAERIELAMSAIINEELGVKMTKKFDYSEVAFFNLYPDYYGLSQEEKKKANSDLKFLKEHDEIVEECAIGINNEILANKDPYIFFREKKIGVYLDALYHDVNEDKQYDGVQNREKRIIQSHKRHDRWYMENNINLIEKWIAENPRNTEITEKDYIANVLTNTRFKKYWNALYPDGMHKSMEEENYHREMIFNNISYFEKDFEEHCEGTVYNVQIGSDRRTLEERMQDVYDKNRAALYRNRLYPNRSKDMQDEEKKQMKIDYSFIEKNLQKIDIALMDIDLFQNEMTEQEKVRVAIDKVKSDLEKNNEQETSLSGKRQEKKALSTKALAIKEQIEALEKVKSQTKGE